jgi:hypothetical protein
MSTIDGATIVNHDRNREREMVDFALTERVSCKAAIICKRIDTTG